MALFSFLTKMKQLLLPVFNLSLLEQNCWFRLCIFRVLEQIDSLGCSSLAFIQEKWVAPKNGFFKALPVVTGLSQPLALADPTKSWFVWAQDQTSLSIISEGRAKSQVQFLFACVGVFLFCLFIYFFLFFCVCSKCLTFALLSNEGLWLFPRPNLGSVECATAMQSLYKCSVPAPYAFPKIWGRYGNSVLI